MGEKNGRVGERRPAFWFYPGDWLASSRVQAMTAEQEGGFIRLLCFQWRDGALPSERAPLLRLARVADTDENWEALAGAFTSSAGLGAGDSWTGAGEAVVTGGRVNPRLERERALSEAFSASRRAGGLARAEAKRGPGGRFPPAEPASDQHPVQLPSSPSSSSSSGSSSSSSQKKTQKKPSSAREPKAPLPAKPSAHPDFVDWWCKAFEAATGNAYAFEGAKDGAHVKAILGYAKGDLDLARERAVILLRGEDPYYAEKGINLATLRSQWNRLGSVRPAMTQAQRSLRGAMRTSAEGRTDPLIDRFFDTTLPPERRLGGG